MRDRLIEACGFSWEKISPAIFGALFQSVMNAKERRAKGDNKGGKDGLAKGCGRFHL